MASKPAIAVPPHARCAATPHHVSIERMIWQRLSSLVLTAVFSLSAVAPAGFAASAPSRNQAQAQLLDHAEFRCSDCFFGASKYYYCFQADNKILIGYQKTPTLNYTNQSKNYLTQIRPAWAAWIAEDQTVPITYDDKYIWIARPPARKPHGFWAGLKGDMIHLSHGEGKQVRLKRSEMRDIFINDGRCHAPAAAPSAK